ncbi:MAG: helix-turn-helix domain-containing protein [Candidatus Levybacteria bacterium]|nr:helix-turn-helix domain-containing protein [Candidatus Levybacteria bacterium]
MPHVSQRILDSKTKRQITDTFELVLGKMNKNETNTFLFSLLSDTERLMLAKRLAIAVLLSEGVSQSSIAEVLCVTRETVNRIDLALMKRSQGFQIAFKKINDDQVMQGVKNMLVKLASYSIKAAGGRVDL